MPDHPGPTPHLTLVTPRANDLPWRELGRAAARLCGAEDGGVDPAGAANSGAARDLLARRLARSGGCAIAEDGRGTHYAAVLTDPDAAMLWIARQGVPFDRHARAQLRWLAAGGTELLRILDAERAQTELLLQENRHRCANDLQLVGGLLSHQARVARERAVSTALETVADRVMTLARARQLPPGDLVAAMRACTEALAGQVGDRGIAVSLRIEGPSPTIEERRAAVLLLAVNELATNAIKHAFAAHRGGRVTVTLAATSAQLRVTVDDDGLPMPTKPSGTGSGLDLVLRLVAGVRGTLCLPPPGTKRFTIEMPVHAAGTTHRREE